MIRMTKAQKLDEGGISGGMWGVTSTGEVLSERKSLVYYALGTSGTRHFRNEVSIPKVT